MTSDIEIIVAPDYHIPYPGDGDSLTRLIHNYLVENTHVLSFTPHFIHVSKLNSSVQGIVAKIRRDVMEHAAFWKSQFNFKRPDELDRFTHEIIQEMHKELAPLRCEFFTNYVIVSWFVT